MRSCFEFIKKEISHELVGAEIGVHMGNNAEDILKNLNIKKLYLIDSWQGMYAKLFEAVHNKFNGDKRVCLIRASSVEAGKLITESLDFAYIDADHSCKAVMQDLHIWTKKVKLGGFVCGHDYTRIRQGVKHGVWNFCAKRNICYSVQSNGEKVSHRQGGKRRFSISCDWWFQKGEEIEIE